MIAAKSKLIRDYVKAHWKNETIEMMAKAIGVDGKSISCWCKKLGVRPISPVELKVNFILKNRGRLTPKEMAKELDVSEVTIYMLLKKIKSGEIFTKPKSRFKPGNSEIQSIPKESFSIRFDRDDYLSITKSKYSI